MSVNFKAGASLLFYTGINYAGTATPVAHGVTGTLATGSDNWNYRSVAMSAMHAFCWSEVNLADASMNYQNHTESLITASIADLTALYAATAFPLSFLGIDPAIATPVWLDMSAVTGNVSAVAATSVVGAATTSITTLSRPGLEGVAGFVGLTPGSSMVASCSYGTYNSATGQVAWSGLNAGTLVLEYTGGAVIILSATGFPDGWAFAAPVMQADGSWKITVSGGAASGNVISSLVSDQSSIVNNGTSAAVLTATVTGAGGLPASGVTVNWSTTQGSLSVSSSVTGSTGQATVTLTDTGDTGACVVTASLDTGSTKSVSVALTDGSGSDVTLVSVTSDKDTIANDGEDQAYLTATVQNSAGNPVQGVTVSWSTDLGTLNHSQQATDATGQSHAKLSDLGDTGTAVVTASLPDGSYMYVKITVEENGGALVISSLTSDKTSIADDGTETASLTARVTDGSGMAVSGVTVNWSTTAGNLSAASSVTDSSGKAITMLSGDRTTDTATVTASLDDGSIASVDITFMNCHFTFNCSSGGEIGSDSGDNVMTNKISIYGHPGAVAYLTTDNGIIHPSGEPTSQLILDETGYGLAEVGSLQTGCNVTVQIGNRQQSAYMTFTGPSQHTNSHAVADGRTPLTMRFVTGPNPNYNEYLSVMLSGTTYFTDGTQTKELNYVNDVAIENVIDTVGGRRPYQVATKLMGIINQNFFFEPTDYSAKIVSSNTKKQS